MNKEGFMRKFLTALGVVAVAFIAIAPGVAADQDPNLHCPDGGTKVEVNDENESTADDQATVNALVLAAGTRVCVKAGSPQSNDSGDGNTGIVIADGEDTLQELLFQAGIKDGSGEQGRDVSYYVVYPPLETTTTTAPPTTTTTVAPTTTTTAPAVTTTTQAPVVTTAAPQPQPVGVGCDIGTFTHCPGQPHGGPADGQLPRTGSGSSALAIAGLALLVSGVASVGISKLIKARVN